MTSPSAYSVSLTATVSASSYWDEGPCANEVCSPVQVIDAQTVTGINSGAGTRWASKPDYVNSTGSCNPQWINFVFGTTSSPIVLDYANVQYGDTSDTFDGGVLLGARRCPNVSVAYSPIADVTFYPLTSPDDFSCMIGSTADNGVSERLDTLTFANTSKYNANVKQMRFSWSNLVPRGSFGTRTCQMDVSEIFIARFNSNGLSSTSSSSSSSQTAAATNGGSASGTDATVSTTSSSSLSGVAVAFIVIAAIVGACVGAVLFIRYRNIEKRRKRAAELRALRSGFEPMQ
ncbi:hypothetical protein DFJ73DRAFT_465891 [Zopfochytrium polystomum]|nr:hypothetical protein DFJ73DRAFT_465891 [Zopfochytrium polystomum]